VKPGQVPPDLAEVNNERGFDRSDLPSFRREGPQGSYHGPAWCEQHQVPWSKASILKTIPGPGRKVLVRGSKEFK